MNQAANGPEQSATSYNRRIFTTIADDAVARLAIVVRRWD